MSLIKFILKYAVPLPNLEKFQKFLFIGPHPDDIEIGAGATAAKLASMGKKVCFLICLDGRYGDGNTEKKITRKELIELRKKEAIKSASHLGVKDVRFLNLYDGGFYKQNDLLVGIAKTVGDFKPEVIFAPDPYVTSECHIDHINVGNAAKQIAYFAPYKGIMKKYEASAAPVKALAYYMTAKPTQFIKTDGYLKKQLQAIFCCHLSQFPTDSDDTKSITIYLKLRSLIYGLRNFSKCAEGFRVLGVTQMHCLPEAEK